MLVDKCSLLFKVCTDGKKIRLVNGYTENDSAGRVEVCVNGRWGTVQTRGLAETSCTIHLKELVAFSTCLGEKKQPTSPCPPDSLLQHTGTQYGYRQSKPVHYCDVNTLTCSEGSTDDHNADLGVVCGSPLNESECIYHNMKPNKMPDII